MINTKKLIIFTDGGARGNPGPAAIGVYVLDENGKAMQYELAHLQGMTRLKAHRIVSRLESQGIIAVERIGKVNAIKLVEEVRDALI